MRDGKKILAVIPARGGSKGIKLKNLLKIDNISLVGRACMVANKLKIIDRVVISTDHFEILEEAKKYSVNTPFIRPENLSGDAVSDLDVLNHALIESENFYNEKYDLIIMLQPTSPLRKSIDILEAIDVMLTGNYDSVWSLSPSDPKMHPYKQLIIENDKINYAYPEEGSKIIARQQLSQMYHRNGVVYVITKDCLINKRSIKGDRCGFYLSKSINISIDNMDDVNYIKYLIDTNQVNINEQ